MIPLTRRHEIMDEFRSENCKGCGGKKKSTKSHCRHCYFSLPVEMQKNLYKRFGSGYEEAYEESLQYLSRKKIERERQRAKQSFPGP